MHHKVLLPVLLLLTLAGIAQAHPGIGIVKDKKGNIYYTDLKQVKKIDKNGKISVAVPNVHTHELYMSPWGTLNGDNLIYTGGDSGKYYHEIWWMDSTGKIDHYPRFEGFSLSDNSFVVDEAQGRYIVTHFNGKHAIERWEGKAITMDVKGDFEHVQWLHYHKGKVYFVNHDALYSIRTSGNDTPVLIVSGFGAGENDHHATFGIWSDDHDNIYVANATLGAVQAMNDLGKLTTIYRSKKGWIPTGGLFDDDGVMHVLEYSDKNEARVIKTRHKSGVICGHKGVNDLLPIGTIVIVVVLVARWRRKRRARAAT